MRFVFLAKAQSRNFNKIILVASWRLSEKNSTVSSLSPADFHYLRPQKKQLCNPSLKYNPW
jgi:hypothetical protein